MKFAEFVPQRVRTFIAARVEGDEEAPGWGTMLPAAKTELAEIRKALRGTRVDARRPLEKEHDRAAKHLSWLQREVGSLTRLGTDVRMGDCFHYLSAASFNEEQVERFIEVAWMAHMDFSEYRHRLKKAANLRDGIEKAAGKLSTLLRQLGELEVLNAPGELFSIPALIRQSDYPEKEFRQKNWAQHDFWCSMRRILLGDKRSEDEASKPAPKDGQSSKWEIQFVEPGDIVDLDPEEAKRAFLHYAWEKSPPVSAMIDAIAVAASRFEPSLEDDAIIYAAIASRQSSKAQNKEYLRAFGKLLERASPAIVRTIPVINAIAVAATVVINDPDFMVTYDDVVKAIGGPVETRA
jgi:hypothetical protein